MDYDFLKQIGLAEVRNLFESKPYVYLIDANCMKRKTLKLKKVKTLIITSTE